MTHLTDLAAWQTHRDTAARNRVVAKHWPRAKEMCRKWSMRYGTPIGDLLGEAGLALLEACDVFDPERGLDFWRLAWHHVRKYLSLAVRKNSSVAKHPNRAQPRFDRSLNMPRTRGADDPTWLQELLPAEFVDPAYHIDADRARYRVRVALTRVHPRARKVVEASIMDDKPIAVVAEGMGFSRQRGHQLKNEAFAVLREELADVAP